MNIVIGLMELIGLYIGLCGLSSNSINDKVYGVSKGQLCLA